MMVPNFLCKNSACGSSVGACPTVRTRMIEQTYSTNTIRKVTQNRAITASAKPKTSMYNRFKNLTMRKMRRMRNKRMMRKMVVMPAPTVTFGAEEHAHGEVHAPERDNEEVEDIPGEVHAIPVEVGDHAVDDDLQQQLSGKDEEERIFDDVPDLELSIVGLQANHDRWTSGSLVSMGSMLTARLQYVVVRMRVSTAHAYVYGCASNDKLYCETCMYVMSVSCLLDVCLCIDTHVVNVVVGSVVHALCCCVPLAFGSACTLSCAVCVVCEVLLWCVRWRLLGAFV